MTRSNLAKANRARLDAHLSKRISTRAYGIVTLREMIHRRIAAGAKLEIFEYLDHAKRARLEREYARLNRGFNVPWGNAQHPTTIKAQALKDRLAGKITSPEYRIYDPHDAGVYYPLSKIAYEYAQSVQRERSA